MLQKQKANSMKIKMQWIKYFILSLIFTTLGATITILVKKTTMFTISNELNLPDILTLIITFIVTLYIALFLEKSKNNERISKDTMIGYYKEYGATFNKKVRGLCNGERVSIITISSVYKLERIKLYKLNEFVKAKKLINVYSVLHKNLFDEVKELWTICTDGRDITLPNDKEEIEINLMKIDIIIYELIFEINNL